MEQLILLAIFLLVGLLNVVIRWLRQRADASSPETGSSPPPTLGLPPAARTVVPPPAQPTAPAVRAARPPVSRPPQPRRRPAAGGRLHGRADLRRAIVAMTVLGPCRALEDEGNVRTPGPAAT